MAIYIALALLTVAALAYLLPQATRALSRRRLISQHGCEAPASYATPETLQADFAHAISGPYMHWIQENFARLGRTWMWTPAKTSEAPWFFTCDPVNLKAIATSTTTHPGLFAVEPMRRPETNGFIGDGVIMSDGDKWRFSRSLFKPMFDRAQVSNLARFQRHVDELISKLPTDGKTVDLQVSFKRLYLEYSTDLFFGCSFEALGFNADEFEASFAAAVVGMTRNFLTTEGTSFWQRGKDKESVAWRKACDEVRAVFDASIDRAITDVDAGKMSDEKGNAAVSMVHELVKISRDRAFLRDQLLNVFLGSKDTAAGGISLIFFHLARYPTVWRKLREEVLAIPEDKPLTFEFLKSMKYMQCVISESLRLLSPVGISIRNTTADTVLPSGGGPTGNSPIFVPKGSRIESSIFGLHYDPKVWGADVAEFKPERWEGVAGSDPDSKRGSIKAWEYAPFLGGPRFCPAQQMMLTQFAVTVIMFMQKYEAIENRDPSFEFVPEIHFSHQSKNGVQIALQAAA